VIHIEDDTPDYLAGTLGIPVEHEVHETMNPSPPKEQGQSFDDAVGMT
jgi:hypothetical protein